MSDKPVSCNEQQVSSIKTATERLSDYLKTLSPLFNQFAIAHISETVLPQFKIEETIELRAAYEALKAENQSLRNELTLEKMTSVFQADQNMAELIRLLKGEK